MIGALHNYELLSIYATCSFLLSLIITISLVPIVNKIGLKYKIIDIPDKRKTHKQVIVRLGGLGILLGFIITTVIFSVISKGNNFFTINPNFINTLITGCILFFIIGILDDIKRINPFIKLIIQIIISSSLYMNGVEINGFYLALAQNINDAILFPKLISYIITIIIISGLINAFNWLDGLDGLASGISAISGIGIMVIATTLGKYEIAIIVSALCGSTIGFLRYNFFPAKILMGDGGSYLIGAALSILSIYCLGYEITNDTNSIVIGRLIPVDLISLIFLIPIIDMLTVLFKRIKKGKSPFYPDRSHIHHKILDSGVPQRYAVIILYSISQLSVATTLIISDASGKIIYICLSTIFVILSILYCLNMKKQLDSNYKKYIT